jgi:translation elongation factor EF-G
MSSGQGTFRMHYYHHEVVPANIAERVVAEAQQEDS